MTTTTEENTTDGADYPAAVDEMVSGYLVCALWAGLNWSVTTDHGGTEDNPVPWDDDYDISDISSEAITVAREFCGEFYIANADDLATYFPGSEPGQWGHDLYLTRNGHGAGFWDRYYGSDDSIRSAGRRLSEAAKVYGEADFFLDVDGSLNWG